jgi:fluoride exporter
MITAVLFIVAAAAGACCRAIVGHLANERRGFAYGTLTVNVVGSFALGALQGVARPELTVVGVGFLGALTTFSSFTRDTVALAELRKTVLASIYLLLTLSACIGAAALGLWVS